MRVGWLADDPGYIGGAELTQAEFRAAAPDGVEVVDCAPGAVREGLDLYVIHNHQNYTAHDWAYSQPAVFYHHDVRGYANSDGKNIFCSPLQRGQAEGPVIPPPVDMEPFREAAESAQERRGAVWLGVHMHHPGKGFDLVREWGEVDAYDSVPYEEVPELLARYETFVHLPRAMEPFGRTVVEAWAAGCQLVINGLVGARYWIEEKPEKLESAASDFWEVVLDD